MFDRVLNTPLSLLRELSELRNFYSPLNHQKPVGFLMISGGLEVNLFAKIRLILEVKFRDDPSNLNYGQAVIVFYKMLFFYLRILWS